MTLITFAIESLKLVVGAFGTYILYATALCLVCACPFMIRAVIGRYV